MTTLTSRETSPMPPNIQYIRDSLPPDSRLTLANGNANQPPLLRFINGVRRYGDKLLLGSAALGGLYGAYKLGQHKNAIINRLNKLGTGFYNWFHHPRSNLTRSHT